jgi:hypothetical protein
MPRALGWAGLAGCAENAFDLRENGSSKTSDLETDTSTPTEPPPEERDIELFSVDVSFALQSGAWAPEPVLRADLYSPEVELVCSQRLPVLSITPEPAPDGEPLVAWWVVELGEGVPDLPCPEWPARSWRLGLGPYDVRLDPAMAARDMLGYDVYGLYVQEDPLEPVYVVGIAGTPEMLEGKPDLTVESPPLADGAYRGLSLVALTMR